MCGESDANALETQNKVHHGEPDDKISYEAMTVGVKHIEM